MENIIDKLNFNNKEVHIIVDKDNNHWCKGTDVARILDYKRTRDAISLHVDEEDRIIFDDVEGSSKTPSPLNMQPNTIFINESGLYSLILLPQAKEFKKSNLFIKNESY